MSLLTICGAEGASLDDVIASAEARLVSVDIPFVTFRHEPADTVADLLRVTTHMPGGKCTYARMLGSLVHSSPPRASHVCWSCLFLFPGKNLFLRAKKPKCDSDSAIWLVVRRGLPLFWPL